jgi:outer membrane protein assembly factor BamB
MIRSYAINPDGSLKWSFTTGGWVYSSPAIGADGASRVMGQQSDGSQKWSFTTGDEIWSSPAIDGTIYFGIVIFMP